jgi:hypothetical protein
MNNNQKQLHNAFRNSREVFSKRQYKLPYFLKQTTASSVLLTASDKPLNDEAPQSKATLFLSLLSPCAGPR